MGRDTERGFQQCQGRPPASASQPSSPHHLCRPACDPSLPGLPPSPQQVPCLLAGSGASGPCAARCDCDRIPGLSAAGRGMTVGGGRSGGGHETFWIGSCPPAVGPAPLFTLCSASKPQPSFSAMDHLLGTMLGSNKWNSARGPWSESFWNVQPSGPSYFPTMTSRLPGLM